MGAIFWRVSLHLLGGGYRCARAAPVLPRCRAWLCGERRGGAKLAVPARALCSCRRAAGDAAARCASLPRVAFGATRGRTGMRSVGANAGVALARRRLAATAAAKNLRKARAAGLPYMLPFFYDIALRLNLLLSGKRVSIPRYRPLRAGRSWEGDGGAAGRRRLPPARDPSAPYSASGGFLSSRWHYTRACPIRLLCRGGSA